MSQKEDLGLLLSLPEAKTLIEVEKKLRDDAILRMMQLTLDDPVYERKLAYYKGLAEGIINLWAHRDRIRDGRDGAHIVGGKNVKKDED